MHIRRIHAAGFKRFSDLTIELAAQPRLVVMCGPNGSGKSSVIEALWLWSGLRGGGHWSQEADYQLKGPVVGGVNWASVVEVDIHEPITEIDTRKLVYVRTAYRNDPEFMLRQLTRTGELLDARRHGFQRVIDNDARVARNYERLVGLSVDTLFSGTKDAETVGDLREAYVGQLRDSLRTLFPDLVLEGLGDPLGAGTFRFTKGSSAGFLYKNLSGGEKAAFDLLLDLFVTREAFDNTVFCVDEPEAHIGTRVQASLLKALVALIPPESQLWIATHSIGMLRQAVEMHEESPDDVAFLDFAGHDFDASVVIVPTAVSRHFWLDQLEVALGDVAALVAPSRVVLCEGKPTAGTPSKAEFDARCFRRIFGPAMPDVHFISIGNAFEVAADRLEIGRTIQTLAPGTTVIRAIDRDLRDESEVVDLQAAGVRVLRRRHLEAFLVDDEVLQALAIKHRQPTRTAALIAARDKAVAASVGRGNDPDDMKSAAGEFTVACRKLLQISQGGSTYEAFFANILAPLIVPGMAVYEELRHDIFGS